MAITFDDLKPGDFQPTSIDGGLPKLVRIWEHLRELNWGGYGGAVLVDVKDGLSKGKSGVTSCSPFTATPSGSTRGSINSKRWRRSLLDRTTCRASTTS